MKAPTEIERALASGARPDATGQQAAWNAAVRICARYIRLRQTNAAYYRRHRDRTILRATAYYRNNKDKVLARMAARRKQKKDNAK